MNRIVAGGLAAVLLSGCASTPIRMVESTQSRTINDPAVGATATRGIGETLIAQGVRTTGPALEVIDATQFNKADGEKSIMTCAVTVQPGNYFKRGEYTKDPQGADCYGPVQMQLTLADGGTNWNCPGQMMFADICRDAQGNYFAALALTKAYLKQDFDHLRVGEKVVERKPNFVQELVYTGRERDTLKLLYREFSDDIARPAFAQELTYDLAESRTVGFRSARIEVVEANNTEITYRLVSGFEPSAAN